MFWMRACCHEVTPRQKLQYPAFPHPPQHDADHFQPAKQAQFTYVWKETGLRIHILARCYPACRAGGEKRVSCDSFFRGFVFAAVNALALISQEEGKEEMEAGGVFSGNQIYPTMCHGHSDYPRDVSSSLDPERCLFPACKSDFTAL